MSKARPIFEGITQMVTRRTRGRTFLLRPSERTTQIFLYMLAVFATKYEILVHAVTALSNHYHLVATDPKGRITDFTRDFHSFVARHINAAYGDFENLWATTQTSLVRLETPADILREIAYTLANPVLSFLVKEGRHWPGARRVWPAPPLVIKRPWGFFDQDSERWPETVTLEMARPPGFEELSDALLTQNIVEAIAAREEEGRQTAREKGIRFLGRRAILKQARHAVPKSRERRFQISPRVACKDKWRRIERLRANRAWLEEYEPCYRRWRAGERDVVFPYGTNKMRAQHGVRVAPRPG